MVIGTTKGWPCLLLNCGITANGLCHLCATIVLNDVLQLKADLPYK